jgi:2-(3-amino-3-carboxypropyl)histidine synthase
MRRCTSADAPYDEEDVPRVAERLDVSGRVLVQAPDGLKGIAREVADVLEGRGCEVVLDAGRVFGACDVTLGLVEGVDCLVHIGHYPIPSVERRLRELGVRTFFLPTRGRKGVEEWMVEEAVEVLRSLGVDRVDLCATGQHVHELGRVAEVLEREGIRARVGRGDSERVPVPGLVLGCNFSCLGGRPVVIVCSGRFHPLGARLRTGRPVVQIDPVRGVVDPESLEEEVRRVLAVRLSKIREFDPGEGVEVVGSTCLGQRREDVLEALGGPRWEVRYLSEDVLRAVRCEQCVYCGCPRVPVDESARFRRWVVLNPAEAALALGGGEEYRLDEIPTDPSVLRALRGLRDGRGGSAADGVPGAGPGPAAR